MHMQKEKTPFENRFAVSAECGPVAAHFGHMGRAAVGGPYALDRNCTRVQATQRDVRVRNLNHKRTCACQRGRQLRQYVATIEWSDPALETEIGRPARFPTDDN